MYQLLVPDPDDVLAALAYTAYKQHEVEAMTSLEAASGNPPTQAEIDGFYRAASTATMLEMYADRAEALINAFLAETLQSRESALENQFATTEIGLQLKGIQEKQRERRTWKGWTADVGGNITVNFMTLIFVAALVFGYRQFDDWMSKLGHKTGALAPEVGAVVEPSGIVPAALPPASAASQKASSH